MPWKGVTALLCKVVCSLFAAVVVAVLAPVSVAWASYPGRAGAIAFQRGTSYTIENDNGVAYDAFALRSVATPSHSVMTSVSCQGSELGFGNNGLQYCPESGPSFSPDGQSLVFSGVRYQNDGSSTPDQSTSGCPGSCEAIVLGDADGTALRVLPIALGDAEQPAFMPGGNSLVFTGTPARGALANLYTVATDGSAMRQVTTDGGRDPAPCANGSILFIHRGDLYLRSVTGRTRRLTFRGASLPDCSRDSRTAVFLRDGALYTISATGGHLRHLTRPNASKSACFDPSSRHTVCVDGRPAFSPAGGLIAINTVSACTSGCGEHFECTPLTERLQLIDLRGRTRYTKIVGTNHCQPDYGLADDQLRGVAWQPLGSATPTPGAPQPPL